jgi:hypothetical protein
MRRATAGAARWQAGPRRCGRSRSGALPHGADGLVAEDVHFSNLASLMGQLGAG